MIIGLEHQNQNYSGIVANLKVYLENLQAIDNASFQKELMDYQEAGTRLMINPLHRLKPNT